MITLSETQPYDHWLQKTRKYFRVIVVTFSFNSASYMVVAEATISYLVSPGLKSRGYLTDCGKHYMDEQTDDIAIIQLVLQGQQAAYATLVQRYGKYVFTLALRYVRNREVAEELAQDVFVKAYRCLADFRRNGKFSTWLYMIVHTTCLSHMRKRRDSAVLVEEEKIIALADSNSHEQPAQRLEQKMQQQMIENALKQLPEADAQVLTLFYQADQSVEEIGSVMGMTAGNVKVRLFRARQKMREILNPYPLKGSYKTTTA